jgi:hypothetical protein
MRSASACRTLPHRFAQVGRRRDLDHLLVAALHGAVALVQVHQVPADVAQDLHLDVAHALEVLLQEHDRAAERRHRLRAGLRDRVVELVGLVHDAHPAAAAAVRGFDQHGRVRGHEVARRRARVAVLQVERQARDDRHAGPTPASRASTLSPIARTTSGRGR